MSKWLTKRNIIIFFSIIATIIGLIYIVPVSLPIIFALLTAMMIDPLVKLVETRFKWSRKWAVISVFIFILLILSTILYYTVTRLIGKIIEFTQKAPEYFNVLSSMWIDMQNKLFQFTSSMPKEVIEGAQDEFKNIFDSIRESILELVSYENITSLLTNIPNFLVSLIVFIIALFLFMLELPELKQMFFQSLKTETAYKVRFMLHKLNEILIGFLKAQVLVSLIIFAAAFIGLLLIHPKYALLMAIIIWIIDLIPILGSIIILGPWVLYSFMVGDVSLGTKLSILAIILLVIRRTVEPKVMGSQIGLKPLPTLIAMFIGLKLFGFLGFFIGPLIVILFTTAREANIIRFNIKI